MIECALKTSQRTYLNGDLSGEKGSLFEDLGAEHPWHAASTKQEQHPRTPDKPGTFKDQGEGPSDWS